jgi:RHH-type rel operon transcriptional repressor/antitoxin RelB
MHTEAFMALSVRLEPALEARVDQEARRLGVSKSEFVKDALERVLGLKNPYALLRQVRSNVPMGRPDASEATGKKLKAKLRAQRAA